MNFINAWVPCLADMTRDVAFFDGLTIEVDRITDPREDRVLPILAEEQVYMCRMMEPLLRARVASQDEPPLVLDIGTGSGVFAIYAAQIGCKVVAIDISLRALLFARHNVELNKNISEIQIKAVEGEPRNAGEIWFRQLSFKDLETQLKEKQGHFDFVFLSPPYNPTCECVSVALHASAGELGQEMFEKQLSVAALFLKRDGVCIGNQMILAGQDKNLKLPQVLHEKFQGGTFSYTRILPENEPKVGDFLEYQYTSYRNSALFDKEVVKKIKKYIERHSKGDTFSLIYFELESSGPPDAAERSAGQCTIREVQCELRVPRTWDDRKKLHRQIVDYISDNPSLPVMSLFMEHDALPRLDKPGIVPSKDSVAWNGSVLRVVEKWLVREGLFGSEHEKGLLDLLLIDTAPWFPTPDSRNRSLQESIVWTSPSFKTDNPDVGKIFLEDYQDNTKRQQLTGIGPFLHRHFTGAESPCSWRNFQITLHDQRSKSKVDMGNVKSKEVQSLINKLNACLIEREKMNIDFPSNSLLEAVYVHSRLEDLEVLAVKKFNEIVKDRVEYRKNQYPKWEGDLYTVDLGLCHQAMHWRIDDLLSKFNVSPSSSTTLIGIPVSLSSSDMSYEDHNNCASKLPDDYRGGIWIYALTQEPWTPSLERYLMDLARLLTVMYANRYSTLAAEELKNETYSDIFSSITHELNKIQGALNNKLLVPFPKLFSPAKGIKRTFGELTQAIEQEEFTRGWFVQVAPEVSEAATDKLTLWIAKGWLDRVHLNGSMPFRNALVHLIENIAKSHDVQPTIRGLSNEDLMTPEDISDFVSSFNDRTKSLAEKASSVLVVCDCLEWCVNVSVDTAAMFFCRLFSASLSNAWEKTDKITDIKVTMYDEVVSVCIENIADGGEASDEMGTKKVLRFLVGLAGGRKDKIVFKFDDHSKKWITSFSIPAPFLKIRRS